MAAGSVSSRRPPVFDRSHGCDGRAMNDVGGTGECGAPESVIMGVARRTLIGPRIEWTPEPAAARRGERNDLPGWIHLVHPPLAPSSGVPSALALPLPLACRYRRPLSAAQQNSSRLNPSIRTPTPPTRAEFDLALQSDNATRPTDLTVLRLCHWFAEKYSPRPQRNNSDISARFILRSLTSTQACHVASG